MNSTENDTTGDEKDDALPDGNEMNNKLYVLASIILLTLIGNGLILFLVIFLVKLI